jgi:hypothetical protein
VSSAAAGSTVCLAAGTYGAITLNASKSALVTLRAASPGAVQTATVTLNGRNLGVSDMVVRGSVRIAEGSSDILVDHNDITGGYFGVEFVTGNPTTINRVTVRGNRIHDIKASGEDGIRVRGTDVLIEGNEFTQIVEGGNHNDCLQADWGVTRLTFRQNYLHDNRCQGFFLKDAHVDSIVTEQNLFLRNGVSAPGQGQPSYYQIGDISNWTSDHDTIWDPSSGSGVALRVWSGSCDWSGTNKMTNGVFARVYTDAASCIRPKVSAANNLYARMDGWSAGTNDVTITSPAFNDPANDDYRILTGPYAGRGVNWRPTDQQYGPA